MWGSEGQRRKNERSPTTWGFITAARFAVPRVPLETKRLVRRQMGSSRAVMLSSAVLLGVAIVIAFGRYTSHSTVHHGDAYDPSLQSRVETAITEKAPSGVTISKTRCLAVSGTRMTCVAYFRSGSGVGQATYDVVLNPSIGNYVIGPIVSFKVSGK